MSSTVTCALRASSNPLPAKTGGPHDADDSSPRHGARRLATADPIFFDQSPISVLDRAGIRLGQVMGTTRLPALELAQWGGGDDEVFDPRRNPDPFKDALLGSAQYAQVLPSQRFAVYPDHMGTRVYELAVTSQTLEPRTRRELSLSHSLPSDALRAVSARTVVAARIRIPELMASGFAMSAGAARALITLLFRCCDASLVQRDLFVRIVLADTLTGHRRNPDLNGACDTGSEASVRGAGVFSIPYRTQHGADPLEQAQSRLIPVCVSAWDMLERAVGIPYRWFDTSGHPRETTYPPQAHDPARWALTAASVGVESTGQARVAVQLADLVIQP